MTLPHAAKLKFWEGWESFGFWAVILGVIGEGLDFVGWPQDYDLRHQIGRGSWLVLIAGLGLEWYAGRRAGAIKDEQVGESFRLGNEAQERAALAIERAAQLEKEAAEARLELERIREKHRKRTISPEQTAAFLEATAQAPKGTALVGAYASEEVRPFAKLIKELLKKAGYRTGDGINGFVRFDGPLPCDIQVTVRDSLAPPSFVPALVEALRNEIGLEVVMSTDPHPAIASNSVKPGEAWVEVYPKRVIE